MNKWNQTGLESYMVNKHNEDLNVRNIFEAMLVDFIAIQRLLADDMSLSQIELPRCFGAMITAIYDHLDVDSDDWTFSGPRGDFYATLDSDEDTIDELYDFLRARRSIQPPKLYSNGEDLNDEICNELLNAYSAIAAGQLDYFPIVQNSKVYWLKFDNEAFVRNAMAA